MNRLGSAGVRKRYEADVTVPALDLVAARLLLAGVSPRDVAETTGMGLRTAYRWRKELRAVETVVVDGWSATFARFRYRHPVRISAWERKAA